MNIAPIAKTAAIIGARISAHAPAILTYAGLGSMTAAAVISAKLSTRYLEVVTEPIFEELTTVEEVKTKVDAGVIPADAYTTELYKRDKVILWSRLIVRTVKHYALPICLYSGGVAMVIAGHRIGAARLAGAVAAYGTLQTAYDNLRDKIGDTLKDEDITSLLDTQIVRDEKNKIDTDKSASMTPYRFVFDDRNEFYHKDSNGANKLFLESNLNYLNDRLYAKGHLFLNEVLETLGFEHTPAGAVTGWILDHDGTGDGIVSFGRFDSFDERFDANNGMFEYSLDFNVDGIIYDRI